MTLTKTTKADSPHPSFRTNAPHGFGRHALCNLIGGEQQLYSLGSTAHHGRGEGVGKQVRPRALPQQVNERLRPNCVAAWKINSKRETETEQLRYMFCISYMSIFFYVNNELNDCAKRRVNVGLFYNSTTRQKQKVRLNANVAVCLLDMSIGN